MVIRSISGRGGGGGEGVEQVPRPRTLIFGEQGGVGSLGFRRVVRLGMVFGSSTWKKKTISKNKKKIKI